MIPPRRQSREIALKALYQAEINNCDKNESLNQVVTDTLFAPATEVAVKEFLKTTKASEILSGEVEEFIPDFVDAISKAPHNNPSDFRHAVKQQLDGHFAGVTVNESFQSELENLLALLENGYKKPKVVEEFAREIVAKISDNNKKIEDAVSETAKNWALDRMAAVDRCILKIAVCEFFFFPSIPAKATINEAIELAKKYSTDRSYEFVNGILDKVSRKNKFEENLEKTEVDKASTSDNNGCLNAKE